MKQSSCLYLIFDRHRQTRCQMMHLYQTRWKRKPFSMLRYNHNRFQEGSALTCLSDTVYERTDDRNQRYQTSETTQCNQNELDHSSILQKERCMLVMSAAQ